MLKTSVTITLFSLCCCFFLFTNPVHSQSDQKKAGEKSTEERVYPIYKGCGKFKGDNKKLRSCLARKVNRHVKKEINHDVFTALKTKTQFNVLIGVNREGDFKFLKVTPYIPQFSDEFIRIIETLPKIEEPGYVNNEPVRVTFGLPITIKPQPKKRKSLKK